MGVEGVKTARDLRGAEFEGPKRAEVTRHNDF